MKDIKQYHEINAKGKEATFAQAVFAQALPQAAQAIFGAALNELVDSKDSTSQITEEYLLGRYVRDQAHNRMVAGRLVQQYVDGDRCHEIKGEPVRRAEVRFECSHAQMADHITRVIEVSTCSYLFVVGSPRLCASDAVLGSPEQSIKCFPCGPRIELAGRIKPHFDASSLAAAKESLNKPVEDLEKTFWRKKLHEIIFKPDKGQQYPAIYKILRDQLEKSDSSSIQSAEDIPDDLLKQWLTILGVDIKEVPLQKKEEQKGDKSKDKIMMDSLKKSKERIQDDKKLNDEKKEKKEKNDESKKRRDSAADAVNDLFADLGL